MTHSKQQGKHAIYAVTVSLVCAQSCRLCDPDGVSVHVQESWAQTMRLPPRLTALQSATAGDHASPSSLPVLVLQLA